MSGGSAYTRSSSSSSNKNKNNNMISSESSAVRLCLPGAVEIMPVQHSFEGRHHRPSSEDYVRLPTTMPMERQRSQRRRSCPASTKRIDDDDDDDNDDNDDDNEAVQPRNYRKTDASTGVAPASPADSEQRSPADTAASSFDSHREALCKHYHNASSSSSSTEVHPERAAMKRHRRDKTATYGMVGAGVGTLILPVVGTVVGGFLSGYAANQSLKRRHEKIQRRWERDQFQRDASASHTARHAVFV